MNKPKSSYCFVHNDNNNINNDYDKYINKYEGRKKEKSFCCDI